ncbi:MAG: hypothetical protein LBT50_06490 [Prevotellaceae bacterium]|jgi:hypothetical protein|nr:hypothetical protein [Prevotellaceae bacterium]
MEKVKEATEMAKNYPAIENNSEFWGAYYRDFSKIVFKPYMESELWERNRLKVNMFYPEGDDYTLDIDINDLNFKKVSAIVRTAQTLADKMQKIIENPEFMEATLTAVFHSDCMLKITVKTSIV